MHDVDAQERLSRDPRGKRFAIDGDVGKLRHNEAALLH
jgi:hypothetical protein